MMYKPKPEEEIMLVRLEAYLEDLRNTELGASYLRGMFDGLDLADKHGREAAEYFIFRLFRPEFVEHMLKRSERDA